MTLIDELKKCLCPAGQGVFTVYTARQYREKLQKLLYGGVGEAALHQWQTQLPDCVTTHKPLVLGISSDCGGGILRGANWGPLFVREALYQLIDKDRVFDLGDVRVIPQLLFDEYHSLELIKSCKEWLYQDADSTLPASPLSIAEYVTTQLYAQANQPRIFTIGGDHSCSYPVVKSYLMRQQRNNKRVALIQFDAHTDIMQTRMGVPICFGSWTAHVLPYLASSDLLIQIGIRSSSKTRDYWQKVYGVRQYWAHDILENSALAVAQDIVQYLQHKKVDEIYITFDIDALDASIADATGTPETDGLSTEQALILIKELTTQLRLGGADMMEVAPFVHHLQEGKPLQPQSTLTAAAQISAQLIANLNGE